MKVILQLRLAVLGGTTAYALGKRTCNMKALPSPYHHIMSIPEDNAVMAVVERVGHPMAENDPYEVVCNHFVDHQDLLKDALQCLKDHGWSMKVNPDFKFAKPKPTPIDPAEHGHLVENEAQ